MDSATTLVWIAPEPPDAAQARALASWSRAHGVRLTAPSKADLPVLVVDSTVAGAVEGLLDSARDAIAARDRDALDRALSSAESLLRAHPELPQAAWLMAEVDRARSVRWRHIPPVDPEVAERDWLRAEALDGGRVAGLGEESSSKHPPPATVVVDLTAGDDELWLDGERVPETVIATRAGAHALVVARSGAPVWAESIEIPAGSSSIRVEAPRAADCSDLDVARAHAAPNASGASSLDGFEPSQVRCAAWVAATAAGGQGSVRVALCEANRCGPALDWPPPAPWTWLPAQEHADERKGVPWTTWGLVGLGVALAAGVGIVASGALKPPLNETRFVSGGIKKQ